MIPYLRRKVILEMLTEQEIVYIDDLKKAMPDISESTIQRELRSMAQEGLIKRLSGGAVKLPKAHGSSYDAPMDMKKRVNVEAKEKIGKKAASLIKSGDVIFMDVSTTVMPIIKYLGSKKVMVVTTSLRLPEMFNNNSKNITFHIVGGEYNMKTNSVLGTATEYMLSSMFFDKAFLGANGFAEHSGITTPDVREKTKKKLIIQNSKETYFLIDSSKAGVTTLNKVVDLSESTIITEKDHKLLELFERVILAK